MNLVAPIGIGVVFGWLITHLLREKRETVGDEAIAPEARLLEAYAREINTLKNLAEILNQTLPPEKALDAGLEMVAQNVGATAGWILTLTPDQKSVLSAGYNLPPTMELVRERDQAWELCACMTTALQGQLNEPVRVYNCERLKRTRDFPRNEKHHISIPIRSGGKPVGILNLVIPEERLYDEADVRLISAMGDQFGGAIERARLFNEVRKLAITDSLTGLFNRRHFFEAAEMEMVRSTRYNHPLSLAMIDLDRFKKINDTFGHLAGDIALREVARACQGSLRKVDLIGRFGGEEIVILMPETTLDQAQPAFERLRAQVEAMQIETPRGMMQITISIGLAGREVGESITTDELLDRADQALYRAKDNGRNQMRTWGD